MEDRPHPGEPEARFTPKGIAPTEQQRRIQVSDDHALVIEANAGAAKTTSLALRMAEAWARGIAPEAVLALTYTDTACDALAAALAKIGVPARVVSGFRIRTFEAFARDVLTDLFGAVPVLSDPESLAAHVWDAVLEVERAEPPRWRAELALPSLGDAEFIEAFVRVNALLKGSMKDLMERGEGQPDPEYAANLGVEYTQLKVYLAYERIRRRQFEDQPLFRGPSDATYDLARLLHEGEAVRDARSWARGVRVLVVDEMHDLNQAMFLILAELLATTRAFFCGVGDADQVIHETSGAEARFMAGEIEERTHRKVTRLPLTHTFRFGPELAAVARRIAGKPYSSRAAHPTLIRSACYDTPGHCAQQIVDEARAWASRPKAKMSQLAVLVRHGFHTVEIENALLAAAIPYRMHALESYLRRPEVLFIRGLLAIATGQLDLVRDDATREKIMRSLFLFAACRIDVEGRGHESQQALLDEAIALVNGNPHLLGSAFFENQVLRTTDPRTRARLVKACSVARADGGAGSLPAMFEALDIQTLVRETFATAQRRREALGNLGSLQRAALKFGSAAAFFRHLNESELRQQELRSTRSLVLGSVVGVKGLEFDAVVIPFLERGEFPAAKSSERDERNKFYVAATRARHCLTLLSSAAHPGPFGAYVAAQGTAAAI